MTKAITIGKRLVALTDIALVEPFDPASYPDMRTRKEFRTRVVLVDRQSVLTEENVEAFTQAQGFRFLPGETIGVNPALKFSVETFTPAEGFEPTRAFRARLSWVDRNGERQSKLLLSDPHDVLAAIETGETLTPDKPATTQVKSGSSRSRRPTASSDRRKARRQRPPEPVPF